jgi:hypothetical protein
MVKRVNRIENLLEELLQIRRDALKPPPKLVEGVEIGQPLPELACDKENPKKNTLCSLDDLVNQALGPDVFGT